ncbi:MFS transporter, partial [Brenneria alni]|uniref:MFS transporter n=1 Tax=Brenneria alni TaxID=71656 RepID=UPI000EF19628
VILCRFTLTKIVNSFPKELMIIILLFIMTLSLFLMNFVNSNSFYVIPSALLGLSYGLVYPLIQNASVRNADTESERKRNLTLFSLFYFIGVYAFPYVFSLIVTRYGFYY